MSTVVSRTVASTPDRTSSQTWARIISILAPDERSSARAELEKVAGVAASSISSEAPKDDAFVVYGGGSRVRVYCAFGDDAVTRDGVNEEPLTDSPTERGWQMSMPVPPEDLDWSQKRLKALSARVTARAIGEEVPDQKVKDRNEESSSAEIDRREFFRS
jgi:hypothetical protein